jgi:GcrA cell cycle regulator
MKPNETDWTDARISRLRELYSTGLSFSTIAEDIGVTRNAAIGKAHRLNLERRDSPISKPGPKPVGAPKRARKIRPTRQLECRFTPPERAAAVVERLPDPNHDYRCTITELNDFSCRYPLWERDAPYPERLYCGRPGADLFAGRPYCRCHTKLCATP